MKSEGDRVARRKAGSIPPASSADLARLRAGQELPVDVSDIPERTTFDRIHRDEAGRLHRPSVIRDAILRAMAEREMTPYRLWKEARAYCPTISEAAVSEFLKGKRQAGLDYTEAMLAAVGLVVVPATPPARP